MVHVRTWFAATIFAALALHNAKAYGHSGGLDSQGCHHDRKRGGYHCHRTPTPQGLVPIVPTARPRAVMPDPEITQQPLKNAMPVLPNVPLGNSGLSTPLQSAPATIIDNNASLQNKFKRISIEVQNSLVAFGYFDGPVSGIVGPKTKAALLRFQIDFGLTQTGTITPEVLKVMRIEFQ
jgi:hypothetical protein